MTVTIWLPHALPGDDEWDARPVVRYTTAEDGLVGFWLDDDGLHLRLAAPGDEESVVVFAPAEFTGLTVAGGRSREKILANT